MSKISQYAANGSPDPEFMLIGTDPENDSMAGSGTTETVTVAALFEALPGDVARLFTGGHSAASGYSTTEGGERWPTRLAAAMGAEEVTYAVTGAVLAVDSSTGNPSANNPGGYANVWNALVPRSAAASVYSPRNAAPYLPMAPVNAFNYGSNDLIYLTSTTATNVAWFKMALRSCVCVARAGGFFPDTDDSVAYGGTWTSLTDQAEYGLPTSHSTNLTSVTVTVTVPADFPGGEIDMLWTQYNGGGKYSTTADGGAAQVLDATGSAYGPLTGRVGPLVQRLTGLAAGAHTIVTTITAVDGGSSPNFEGWLIAAPALPLTVLLNNPVVPGLPQSTDGAHTPLTEGDIEALNTAITALAAEFTDGMVVVADIAAYFAAAGGNVATGEPGSLYVSDGELNSAGHALSAKCALDAIRSAPPLGAARFAPAGLYMRQVGGPLEPQLAANWAAVDGDPEYFTKDRAGRVELNLALVRSGSPTVGETILTLPAGYWPEAAISGQATSWTSGYAASQFGAVGVGADGVVVWLGGDPTTELDVLWSWQAGGLGA